ncbi:hypothetical protein QFZ49_007015 [Streptomyces turgidiscabies]|uniref:Uncharacterized protein n=1 Tax=Streptomyces turgidiscabies TaxID=85558 RepID=A0ABU0RYK9_9ACTN|nr:hypothetical protein [Streptomyces turgidiscabies]
MPGVGAPAYRLPQQRLPDAGAEPPDVHVDRVQLGVVGADLAVPVGPVTGPADDLAGLFRDQVDDLRPGPHEERTPTLGVLRHAEGVEIRLRHQALVGVLPAPDTDFGDALTVVEGHLADEDQVVHGGTLSEKGQLDRLG